MKIVIIGANAAGLSAASKARRNNPQAEIIVLEQSGDISYGACGLPYFVSGVIKKAETLIAVSLEEFREKRNIDVRLFQKARSFNARQKTIEVENLSEKKVYQLVYDRLIISTGASAVRPPVKGFDHPRVFVLRTLQDGIHIRSFIEKEKPQRAVVIGGGYIGLEMVEALHHRGIQVSLVEMQTQVMPNMDADMAELLEDELKEHQVQTYTGTAVTEIREIENKLHLYLSEGRTLQADMVVMSVGIKPNTEFAQSGGVQLGKTGAIEVDERMQTNLRHVYAAGDCAESRCRVINKATWVALGTTANKQGRVAGDNASGGRSRFLGITSTSAVKVFDLEAGMSGLSSRHIEKYKWDAKSVTIKAGSRAGYYPGSQKITVKLWFNVTDGKLLGAQMIGKEGVSKRIDVLATALVNKMTVEEISELDLSYSPPFAPVWDPVLIAATQALKQVRK